MAHAQPTPQIVTHTRYKHKHRNEAPYLREWIEYHKMIGFDKILLMNDNSTDDTQCILDAYAREGLVVRIPNDVVDDHNFKLHESNDHVFDACVDYMKHQQNQLDPSATWLMTHDVDEFVYYNNTSHESLRTAMKELLRLNGAIAQSMEVPRLFFGSSSHETYDGGLVIDRFNHRFHRGNCPEKERKRMPSMFASLSQRKHATHGRRLSANEAAPTSYCTHGKRNDSYRNVKSISLVSRLAEKCSRMDKRTGVMVADKCASTHRHTLLDDRNNATTISTYANPSRTDKRYLAAEKVGKTISIFHYGIKSRQELYERVCASTWRDKYYKCNDCNPESYFNNTEAFANNYRDDRMASFSAKLKSILAKSDTGANCDARFPSHPIDYYKECLKMGS